jgi:HPt (histidine-containing phosphotransfer) domain-containing protein
MSPWEADMEPSAASAAREAAVRPSVEADRASAAAVEPVESAIDLAHLARMTLGETSLEAEVLRLFERQAAVLLVHMQDATPTAAAAFAHTLKGSARGIGAWGVAAAAEAVENNAERAGASATACAVVRLAAAVEAMKAGIVQRLRRLAEGEE